MSIESEQAVLGSMLIDSGCIRDVSAVLRETDFFMAINQELFRLITTMDRDGRLVDGLTVAEEALRLGIGQEKQIRNYLAQLMEITPTAANVTEYAEIVEEKGRRRMLKASLEDGISALNEGEPEETLLPRLDAAITATTERTASELLAPKEQLDRFFAYRERIDDGNVPYIRTGFRSLDRLLGGGMVQKGLYILAGRPGMGKSALGITIAEYVASTFGRVDYFSLEMSSEQVMSRRIAAISKVNSNVILTQTMTDDEYRKVSEATRAIVKTPMYITDGQAKTIGRITSVSRSSRGCKMVVVDHFGLILVPGKQQSSIEYGAVAHGLKRLAQALDAPVLCLAQLNRENEGRTDKRPRLSDLRATGAIEEDADGVIFLHRSDYYDKEHKRKPMEPVTVEVMLAKNRHGGTGKINLSFWPENNTFKPAWVE